MPAPATLQGAKERPIATSGGDAVFSIDEVARHRTVKDCWVVIGDGVYEMSSWLDEHPGGIGPIMSVAGQDATDHFEAAHRMNPRLERMLEHMRIGSLKGGAVPASATQVVFRRLKKQLEEDGFFDCNSPKFSVLGLSWHQREIIRCLAILAAAIATTLYAPQIWMRAVFGGLLMGLFWQQSAFVGHDLGHSSVTGCTKPSPAGKEHATAGASWASVKNADSATKSAWTWGSLFNDHTLGLVFGNLLSGIGIGWWKSTHNVHHMICNSINRDPDIQHMPLLAVSERFLGGYVSDFHGINVAWDAVARVVVKIQHWIFYPLMAVARFNLYGQSFLWAIRSPVTTADPRGADITEGGVMLGGMSGSSAETRWYEVAASLMFVGWVSALVSTLPSWQMILTWLLVSHAMAGLLHIQICVSHFAMDMFDGCPTECDEAAALSIADVHGLKGKEREQFLEAQAKRRAQTFTGEVNTTPKDFYEHQLRTTMDVDCPTWLDWLHGGLQFQTVHHLFPHVPRYRLRELSALVTKAAPLCGLKYYKFGFFEANKLMVDRLAQVAEQSKFYSTADCSMLSDAINARG